MIKFVTTAALSTLLSVSAAHADEPTESLGQAVGHTAKTEQTQQSSTQGDGQTPQAPTGEHAAWGSDAEAAELGGSRRGWGSDAEADELGGNRRGWSSDAEAAELGGFLEDI